MLSLGLPTLSVQKNTMIGKSILKKEKKKGKKDEEFRFSFLNVDIY